MRKLLLAISLTSVFAAMPATAQVNVGFDAPGVSIGINIGAYPQLVPISGYPIYYAPQLNANYFFYDGMFWIYVGDNWYTSAWYDGPWELVEPVAVPLYILRVPVRYYRRPPPYFRSWVASAPPHWGEHWGRSWEEHRRGWDRWDRSAAPPPAPLPTYQRQYSGNRYPHIDQQQVLQNQNYRYRPHDAVAQRYYQRLHAGAPSGRGQAAAPPQGQLPQATPPQQAQRGRGQNAAESQAREQRQSQQRQAEQAQRTQQHRQQLQAEQVQRSQQQAQQRQAEQVQRSQQHAQQRQAEQVQRSQQQAQQRRAEQPQQRQAEQAQRAQQQARHAEQIQRSQQHVQERQAEQTQRVQQQTQQRQAEQVQRVQRQAQQQQQREQRVPQGRGEEPKEQRGG